MEDDRNGSAGRGMASLHIANRSSLNALALLFAGAVCCCCDAVPNAANAGAVLVAARGGDQSSPPAGVTGCERVANVAGGFEDSFETEPPVKLMPCSAAARCRRSNCILCCAISGSTNQLRTMI